MNKVLGLSLNELIEQAFEPIPDEIIELAEKRAIARKEKNWAQADELRDEIKKKGYLIQDTQKGVKITINPKN